MRRPLSIVLLSVMTMIALIAPIASAAPPLAPAHRSFQFGGCSDALRIRDATADALSRAHARVPTAARTADVARRFDVARQEIDAHLATCTGTDGERGAVFDLGLLALVFAGIAERAVADVETMTRRILDSTRVRPTPTATPTRTPAPTPRIPQTDVSKSTAGSKSNSKDDESGDDDSDD